MPQRYFFLLFLFSLNLLWSQEEIPEVSLDKASLKTVSSTLENAVQLQDTLAVKKDTLAQKKKLIIKERQEVVEDTATIDMYEIYQQGKRIVHVDTTLTIQKEYKFNFLRKDYFELLPFVNLGSAFNRLGHDFTATSLQPQMGARSKHYAFFEIEDVKYYQVPTPLTELFFRTTMEQGQLTDATITVNTSPQFNFAFAFRGMRSLGKYLNQRSANTAFRLSMTYQSLNERYKAKMHYVNQKHENQENGGITEEGIPLFETGDPDFLERSVLEVRLASAVNNLKGKRSFFEHHYALVHAKDSTGSTWTVGQQIMNESKFYRYQDGQNSSYFGPLEDGVNVYDEVQWAILKNRFQTELENPIIGKLTAGIEFSAIDYNILLPLEEDPQGESLPPQDNAEILPLNLEANQTFLNADYAFLWKGFDFTAHFNKTLFSDRLSDELSLQSKITLANDFFFQAKASFINKSPNFNFIRYRSAYTSYNWYNENLSNEKITSLSATLSHPKWGAISGFIQRLDNYTYYNQVFPPQEEETRLAPLLLAEAVQSPETISYIKARYTSHYDLWKFGFTTTAQYQKVMTQDNSISPPINVPEWNVRTTLSFSSHIFKKALYMCTGITGHYFTNFYADQYNPLLGDFMRQDRQEIGNFPRIDVFFNGKIQQTRIYFKYEHANASFTGYNYYSAVGYPYRDSIIRFGLIWNFFQ
jgi:hypothetical protein